MYRIGEFARLAQVSTHLLRHYNDIGLFVPAKIDNQNGYRYYSAQQLPRLNRILALRELGLSLDQINRILEGDLPASEIEGMLLLRKSQIEQLLREEAARLQEVERRLEMIHLEGQLDRFDVLLKAMPERHIISMHQQVRSVNDWEQLFSMIVHGTQHIPGNGVITAIDHTSLDHDIRGQEIEIGLMYESQPSIKSLTLRSNNILRARTVEAIDHVASVTYVGPQGNGGVSYQKAAHWIEDRGYRIAGPVFEIFHEADQSGHIVFDLQIPVEIQSN